MGCATPRPRAALWHLVLALVVWTGQGYDCSVAVSSADDWASALVECDDVVVLAPGFNVTDQVLIDEGRAVTVTGAGSPTLDCQLSCRFFNVSQGSTLTLSGLILRRGYGYDGGAIYAKGALELTGMRIEDAVASARGGAVFSNDRFAVRNSSFVNCTTFGINTNHGGGALALVRGDWAQIENSVFRGCGAKGPFDYGGAMRIEFTDWVNITNSLFVDNFAWRSGVLYGDLIDRIRVHNSSFQANAASDFAGCMQLIDARHAELTHVDFEHNEAHVENNGWTGGVHLEYVVTVVTNSVQFTGHLAESKTVLNLAGVGLWVGSDINITGNYATDYGIVGCKDTKARLEDFRCIGNQAPLASCMALLARSDVTLTRATIANNNGTSSGAFWLSTSTSSLTLVDSFARDNVVVTSDGYGALARAEGGSTLVLTRTVVHNCSAMAGGAIYLEYSSAAIINSTLHGCTAQEQGGALAVVNGDANITNSTLSDNAVAEKDPIRCVTLTMKSSWDEIWYNANLRFYEVDTGTLVWSGEKTKYRPSESELICFSSKKLYYSEFYTSWESVNSWLLEGIVGSTDDDEEPYTNSFHNFTVDSSTNEDYSCLTNGGGTFHMSKSSNVKVRDTIISGSRSGDGVGGVAYVGGQSDSVKGTLTMDSCTIGHSSANNYGAVFYNALSKVVLTNTWFDNTSSSESGVAYSFGGAFDCKSSCPAGHYGECMAVDDCASCVIDSCFACPPGKYIHNPGSTMADDCADCSEGTYANQSGTAECTTPCPAGMYTTDFSRDTDGFGVSSGATNCVVCPGGRKSASPGASECSSCTPGTFSEANSTECTACPNGTFSSSSGVSSCEECEPGWFASAAGASSCLKCSSEVGLAFTSHGGAAECTLCIAGWYMDSAGDCVACPNGVDCSTPGSELTALHVESGFYRFTSTSTEVYACDFPNNCGGGNETNAQCIRGADGPLCSNCEVGYFLDTFAAKCVECEAGVGALFIPVVAFGSALVAVTLMCVFRKTLGACATRFYQRYEERIMSAMDLATTTVVTMQIIVLLQSNHMRRGGETLQSPYSGFLETFDFLALDFVRGVPTRCVAPVGQFTFVVAWSVLPVLVFAVGAVMTARSSKDDRTYFLSLFVQGLFLLLPTMSTTICEMFHCTSYDGGDYLAVDHEVDCSSSSYQLMVLFACAACLVYPIGVPLGIFIWLAKYRDVFDPPNTDEEIAIEQRKEDPALAHCAVAVFALRHKPRYWYFEVCNMLRRLALTSVPLVFDTSDSMLLFILFVAILTTVVERETQAELDPFLGAFVYVCHWQVVLVIIGMFAVDAEMTEGAGTTLIGTVLLLCNVAVIGVVFIDTRGDVVRDRLIMANHRVATLSTRLQSARAVSPRGFAKDVELTDVHRVECDSDFDSGFAENPLHSMRVGNQSFSIDVDVKAEAPPEGELAEVQLSVEGEVESADTEVDIRPAEPDSTTLVLQPFTFAAADDLALEVVPYQARVHRARTIGGRRGSL